MSAPEALSLHLATHLIDRRRNREKWYRGTDYEAAVVFRGKITRNKVRPASPLATSTWP